MIVNLIVSQSWMEKLGTKPPLKNLSSGLVSAVLRTYPKFMPVIMQPYREPTGTVMNVKLITKGYTSD